MSFEIKTQNMPTESAPLNFWQNPRGHLPMFVKMRLRETQKLNVANEM